MIYSCNSLTMDLTVKAHLNYSLLTLMNMNVMIDNGAKGWRSWSLDDLSF